MTEEDNLADYTRCRTLLRRRQTSPNRTDVLEEEDWVGPSKKERIFLILDTVNGTS